MYLGCFGPKLLWIMPLCFQYFWILPFCMGSIITIVETEQTSLFPWNKSNPMFTDGGAKMSVPVGSNFKIICPQQVNSSTPAEYYAIYWVPAESFNECFLPNDNTKSILVLCNKPHQPFDFTVEITIFSGTIGAKDFEIGKSYYIASFSTGTELGLYNEYHGACYDHNMKINLTIVEQQLPSTAAPSGTPVKTTSRPQPTQTPKPTTTTTTTLKTTTESTTSTTTVKTTSHPTSARPPFSTDIPDPTDNTDSIISVPDNGNTGVIDIRNGARTSSVSPLLLLSFCLSFLHILYQNLPLIQR